MTSYLLPGSGGSGSAINLNQVYESLGWDTSTGSGQTVISSVTTTSKGNFASLGTTASNWAGFYLRIYSANSTGARFLVDLSSNGTTANLVANIFVQPSSGGATRPIEIWIPLQVASGTNLRIRCSCSAGGSTMVATAMGIVASSTAQPGFTTATALTTADTTNNRPNTSSINLQGTGATSWTSLIDPLAATYGAVLMTISAVSTPTTNNQIARVSMADGPTGGGSEVFAGSIGGVMFTSGALFPAVALTVQRSFASGNRISGNIQAAVAGAPDTFSMGLIGFS